MSESSGLVDQFNKPITKAQIAQMRLGEEISPIGAIFGRPPFDGHLAFGIEPRRLGAIIRAADSGNCRDWMILAEEIEELYPHFSSVLGKRRRQVAQLPITVQDADDKVVPDAQKHGDLVRAWLETKTLQSALFDTLDALGKGFSVSELIWDQEPGRAWPVEILYRQPRWFEVSWEDGQTIWLRDQGGFEDLLPHKFLVHRHPSKSGNIVRSGLTRIVAWLWMYSSYTLKDWALFCQGYGMPIRLGRYGPQASDSDKRVLFRAVSSIGGDVGAVIPTSMNIEFPSDKDRAAGSELYLKRADWLDHATSKVVLGGTAGTDAISGGHAVGKEHRAVEEDVERFDAFLLSNSITTQIVKWIITFSFGEQKAYPTVVVGREDKLPIKDVVDAVQRLGGMGLKVKAKQILELLQLEAPEDGDDTVGGVPASITERVQIPAAPQAGKVELPNDTGHGNPNPPAPPQPPRFLHSLLARTSDPDEVVGALTDRLAVEAAGALHGLTDQVRHVFETASSLHDLAHRLHALNLHPQAFGEAMARGMALAQLVGQASLLDELRAQHTPKRD